MNVPRGLEAATLPANTPLDPKIVTTITRRRGHRRGAVDTCIWPATAGGSQGARRVEGDAFLVLADSSAS
jgi:hypothetical protein